MAAVCSEEFVCVPEIQLQLLAAGLHVSHGMFHCTSLTDLC